MLISEMCREAHRNSVEKGFWDGDGHTLPQLPKDISTFLTKLMLIVTEVAEAAEVLREWGHMREVSWVPELHDRVHLAEELADILIRTADLAGALDLDLAGAVESKMHWNKSRPFLHGKLA